MKQTAASVRMRHFSLLIISMGAVLIVMSLIGGLAVLILTIRGALPLQTFSDIRAAVMRIAYYFILPLIGGALLVLSGTTLLNIGSSSLQRSYAASGREKAAKERSRMLDVMLNEDERRVLDLVKENPKGALQSDLVIKSGFSKVKMHRTLKKLEAKELITRGRSGITNKVFLN